MPTPKPLPVVLTDNERQVLQGWARRRTTAQALALRSRIVLACADNANNGQVAEGLGISRNTVSKWRNRFVAARLEGLSDEPRPGAPRTITDEQVEQVIVKTLEEAPSRQDTHWSTRSMATATGMSQTAISRIWRAFGLKPHLVDTWKLSTDPQFIDKVRDVVGLYLDPPENALVLAVDEKSQMQALDRTAPILPIMPGTPARMTHTYIRHGTTSLFAALDIASGSVIAQHYRRHRHQEFLRFLKLIDAAVPDGLDLHLLCDNYATHKTPEVRNWLLRHPRFHLHRVSRGPANALLTTSVEACGWYWTSDSACTTYGPVSRTVVDPPGPPKPPERRAGPCPVDLAQPAAARFRPIIRQKRKDRPARVPDASIEVPPSRCKTSAGLGAGGAPAPRPSPTGHKHPA